MSSPTPPSTLRDFAGRSFLSVIHLLTPPMCRLKISLSSTFIASKATAPTMNASSAAQAARAFMTGPPVGELGLWHWRHNTVRPDAIGTDQPQPVDALGVGEIHG